MSIFFTPGNLRDVTALDRQTVANQVAMEDQSKRRAAVKENLGPILTEPSWYSGVVTSGTGRVMMGIGRSLGMDLFDNDGLYDIPLNFEPKKPMPADVFRVPDGAGDVFEHDESLGKNNIEGLLDLTEGIPDEDRMFILSAESWGEMKDRLTMYHMKDDVAQEEMAANYGGAAPYWSSFAADATSIVTLGAITEPLAWLGTASRLGSAGRNIGTAVGSTATASSRVAAATQMAQLIANAPRTISLLEASGRYAALGVVDQTVINAFRWGFDDFDDRTNQDMALEYAGALAFGGAIGGVLSRRMANDIMAGYAQSAFNTYRVVPVTAPAAGAAATAGTTAAAAGRISSKIVSGSGSTLTNRQAGLVATTLSQSNSSPNALLSALRDAGMIGDDVRTLSRIPNRNEVIDFINNFVSMRGSGDEVQGPVPQLKAETYVDASGAATIASRASEVAENIQKFRASRGAYLADASLTEETTNNIVNRLLRDMRDAGYKVRRLSEIPDDPDTLAKIDAWMDDVENGYNSPFGFRRRTDSDAYGWGRISDQEPGPAGTAMQAPPTTAAAQAIPSGSPGVPVPAAGASPLVPNPTQVPPANPSLAAQSVNNATPPITGRGSPSTSAGTAVQPSTSASSRLPKISARTHVPLPGNTAGQTTPLGKLKAAIPINNIRIPGISRLLNQSAELLRNNVNPLGRLFAYTAANARRVLIDPVTGMPVPQPWTHYEQAKNALDIVITNDRRAHDAYFYRFLLNRGAADRVTMRDVVASAFGAGRRQAMMDFQLRVRQSMTTGVPDANAMVNAYADNLRQTFSYIEDIARREGVRGFEAHRGIQNYFPRLYNFDAIQRLTATPQGRQAFVALLRQSLETIPGQRQLRIWDPVAGAYQNYTFADLDDAAEAFADRLVALSTNSELSPFLDWDRYIVDAIEDMQGPLKDQAGSPTPRGRPRVILNENTAVPTIGDPLNLGRNELRFSDIVNTDTTNVLKKYATSVMGAANERMHLNAMEEYLYQLGFREINVGVRGTDRLRFENYEEFVAFANRTGQNQMEGLVLTTDEIAQMDRVVRDMRFQPRIDTRSFAGPYLATQANAARAAGIATTKAYTFILYAGKFALAALSEIGRIIGTYGVMKVMREVPIALDMARNWYELAPDQRGLTLLLDQFGIATDRVRRVIYNTPEAEMAFSRQNRFSRFLGNVSNSYSDVSGLGPITSFTQFMTGITTLQHLYEVGAGITRRFDDSTIMAMGLTPAQYDQAAQFMAANAVTVRRITRNSVVDINNINDPNFDYVRAAMDRMVKSRIQDVATHQDTSAWADSALGSLMTQFKNYNIKAIDNLLLQNYSRIYNARGMRGKAAAGLKVSQEVVGAFLLAGLIKQALTVVDRENARARGDYKKMYELDEVIGLKGFLRQGILGPGELWIPTFMAEGAWGVFSEEPLLSQFRYSTSDMVSFPALETAQKAGRAGRDAVGAVAQEIWPSDDNPFSRHYTRKSLANTFDLLPFQNFPAIARYLGITEEEIADLYDLPYEQPRR